MTETALDWIDHRPVPLDHSGPQDRPFDPIDEPWLAASMIERFEAVASRFAGRIAVDDGAVQLTYAELRAQAYRLAAQLDGRGGPGEPIAAIIPSNALYPIALLACLAVARPLTPIDVTHPFARRSAILVETKPSLALVAEGAVLEPGLLAPTTATLSLAIDHGPGVVQPFAPRGDTQSALAGIAFTSGSTGRAKGLAYRQRDIFRVVAEHVNSLHINEQDVILSLASLGAGGNLDVLAALLTGARVRMLDIKAAGIGEVLRVMEHDAVTLLSMIPVVFRSLFQQPAAKTAARSLRAITTGGDRLSGADLALFRSVLPTDAHIRTTQGSTETGVVFNWFVPKDLSIADQATVPSGYLGMGKAIALVSPEPEVEGLTGEFLVRGASLAAGAWQDGRLTPGPFVVDPADPALKIFSTGDVVRYRPDGLFEFIGRKDRQIKILGLRADPGEVETILRKAPGVEDVVVIPRRDGAEATLIAYVKPLDLHRPPDPADLRQAVQLEAPAHMVPAEVRFLPTIPRLPNFKPDFVALEALDRFNRPVATPLASPNPSASLDPRLARAADQAWRAVLGEAAAASGAPFDEAGGDSLKALQLVLNLEQQLKTKLPLDLVDRRVTPALLTERLSAALGQASRPDDRRPVVFLCPGVGGDEPRLADLRRDLTESFVFRVVAYPGLEFSAAQLADRERLFAAAQQQVEAGAPSGPIRLCGYSAGGAVAFELARRLTAKGRDVVALTLIDARPEISRHRRASKEAAAALDIQRATQTLAKISWKDHLVVLLVRLQALEILRRLVLWRSRREAHRAAFPRQVFLVNAHGRAFLGWKASSYAGPMSVVVATQEDGAEHAPDLGWKTYAPAAEVVGLATTHWAILNSPMREQLAAILRRTLKGAPA